MILKKKRLWLFCVFLVAWMIQRPSPPPPPPTLSPHPPPSLQNSKAFSVFSENFVSRKIFLSFISKLTNDVLVLDESSEENYSSFVQSSNFSRIMKVWFSKVFKFSFFLFLAPITLNFQFLAKFSKFWIIIF